MPNRFIFRQVYFGDLPTFLADGNIRAKNHKSLQACHQTSYQEIVNRRGTDEFPMPCGGVVNDYVPFYFSPLSSFTFAIHREERVPLVSPTGENLGIAKDEERIFFVCRIEDFRTSDLTYCFSNYSLNSQVPMPILESDLDKLESHVHWDVFDEIPYAARIPEIEYHGVCTWCHNVAAPPYRQLRKQKRMAEFLVRDAVPIDFTVCIIAKSDTMRDKLQIMMDASNWDIPIFTKPGCYF